MQSFIFLTIIAVLFSSCEEKYVRYIPKYPTARGYVERIDSLTPQHQAGIKKVFSYYNVPYKLKNGEVYYKGTIENELLWNYSLKASDRHWLETHN